MTFRQKALEYHGVIQAMPFGWHYKALAYCIAGWFLAVDYFDNKRKGEPDEG